MIISPGSKFFVVGLAFCGLTGAGGCGSSGEPVAGAAGGTSAVSTPASSTETTPPAAGANGTTPPGTFAVGETVKLAHQEFVDGKFVDAPIEVGVSKITKGARSDLSRFDLDAKEKAATPYYVKASFKNVSEISWDPTGMPGALVTKTSGGEPAARMTLIGDFPKCEDTRPKKLQPGKTMRTCTVFMVPDGETLKSVAHRDQASEAYVWPVG